MNSSRRFSKNKVVQMKQKQIQSNYVKQQLQSYKFNRTIQKLRQDYQTKIQKKTNQIQNLKTKLNQQINLNKQIKSDIQRLASTLRQNILQVAQIKKHIQKTQHTGSLNGNTISQQYLNQKLKDYKINENKSQQRNTNQQKSISKQSLIDQKKSINQLRSTNQNSQILDLNNIYQAQLGRIRQELQANINLHNQNINQSSFEKCSCSQMEQFFQLKSLQSKDQDYSIKRSNFNRILTSSIFHSKKIIQISKLTSQLSKYMLSVYKTNANNLFIPIDEEKISQVEQNKYPSTFINENEKQQQLLKSIKQNPQQISAKTSKQYSQKSINQNSYQIQIKNSQQVPAKHSKQYFQKMLEQHQQLITFIFQQLKFSKNYPFMKEKIQRFISNKQFTQQTFKQTYHRLTSNQIDHAYNNYNFTTLSQLSYKLKIQKYQLIPKVFYKTVFVDVEFFECYFKFTPKFVAKLILNIDNMFPNLKILCLDGGNVLDHQCWEAVVGHCDLIRNIQALIINNSRIQTVNQKHLDNLKEIKKLRYFYLGSKHLYMPSKEALSKFKRNNRNIKIQYIR